MITRKRVLLALAVIEATLVAVDVWLVLTDRPVIR